MTSRRQFTASDSGLSYKSGGDWRERAACRKATKREQAIMTTGPGGTGKHNVAPARAAARKFCDTCTVRTECYEWALSERSFAGVAAGMLFNYQADKRIYMDNERRTVRL